MVGLMETYKTCKTIVFRFINDLITINNENFGENIRNIYPAELERKTEIQIMKNVNFLDLNINMRNSRFQTKLYIKRHNSSFNIIRMPCKSNNIPREMFCSAIFAEKL